MAHFFRTMGRLTGRALKTRAVDRAISNASVYILSEMKLADIKLKRAVLRRKRTRHLTILGRTVYRLTINDVNPAADERLAVISRVLKDIDGEIEEVEDELKRRTEHIKQEKKSGTRSNEPHYKE